MSSSTITPLHPLRRFATTASWATILMLSFFEKPLSNRTGLEVMKMAVVQVAPALVLMRGGLEYWWIVCSCQLGDQISSCLRSPFEQYALACFRFYDDFLGNVLTWHKTSWMSSSWPKVRLYHFRNKLSARSFDIYINNSFVVAWLFQHLGEICNPFPSISAVPQAGITSQAGAEVMTLGQQHKSWIQERVDEVWWLVAFKDQRAQYCCGCKNIQNNYSMFFSPNLWCDRDLLKFTCPLYIEYYDMFTPYFWQTPLFRTVGKDSQHRLSLLVRGQEEAMSAKKKWASAKAILHNATVSQNERVVVLVFAVEMGASICPMALS